MEWLEDYKIPVGKASKYVFDWAKEHLKPLFDVISIVLENMIDGILWLLGKCASACSWALCSS